MSFCLCLFPFFNSTSSLRGDKNELGQQLGKRPSRLQLIIKNPLESLIIIRCTFRVIVSSHCTSCFTRSNVNDGKLFRNMTEFLMRRNSSSDALRNMEASLISHIWRRRRWNISYFMIDLLRVWHLRYPSVFDLAWLGLARNEVAISHLDSIRECATVNSIHFHCDCIASWWVQSMSNEMNFSFSVIVLKTTFRSHRTTPQKLISFEELFRYWCIAGDTRANITKYYCIDIHLSVKSDCAPEMSEDASGFISLNWGRDEARLIKLIIY